MGIQIKDIFSRLYKVVFDIFFYTAIAAAVLALLPDHLFNNFPMTPKRYLNEHLNHGIGEHEWNNDLSTKADHIGIGKLVGGESLADVGEWIYTGLADGRLVRIHKQTEKIEDVLRLVDSNQCSENLIWHMKECGRPLGLRYHVDQALYVLDATHGLYRVNLTTKAVKHLLKNVSGKPAIYNDLVFDPKQENLAYITVSTEKWFLEQIAYSLAEHEYTGHILAFDIKTGKTSRVLSNLTLANGIEVTADGKSLLFSETNNYSIKKTSLKAVREAFKTGKAVNSDLIELFGELLPGEPDNIRLDPQNGDILVGMFTSRPYGKLFRDYLGNWAFVRKGLTRLAYSLHLFFDYIDKNLYPNHALKQLSFDFYSGHVIYKIMPRKEGAVLKLDGKTGLIKKVIGAHDFNSVSEAIVDSEGNLWFGSFRNDFVGRIHKGSH